MSNWPQIQAAAKNQNAEILIYGEIGAGGVTAKAFAAQLQALQNPKNLTVRINSPGGETPDGSAIYNMLKRQKTKSHITVYIDGLAASMASLIAMVGDEVIMPRNALMMIHDPAGVVAGNADTMRQTIALLDRVRASMIQAYSEKSGLSAATVGAMMAAETWFDAQEAVDAGLADTIEQPIKMAAHFDLSNFQHAPGLVPAGQLDTAAIWARYRSTEARFLRHKPPAALVRAAGPVVERSPFLDSKPALPVNFATPGAAEATMAAFNDMENSHGRPKAPIAAADTERLPLDVAPTPASGPDAIAVATMKAFAQREKELSAKRVGRS